MLIYHRLVKSGANGYYLPYHSKRCLYLVKTVRFNNSLHQAHMQVYGGGHQHYGRLLQQVTPSVWNDLILDTTDTVASPHI